MRIKECIYRRAARELLTKNETNGVSLEVYLPEDANLPIDSALLQMSVDEGQAEDKVLNDGMAC